MKTLTDAIEVLSKNDFAIAAKRIGKVFEQTIKSSYGQHEPNIVKEISTLDCTEKMTNFSVTIKSVYIHGNKSQVDFEYYNSITQRELGDIIFISSIYRSGNKIFEKVSLNQVKKEHDLKFTLDSSGIEQLYLLSRFPQFQGHSGLIPKKDYTLIDISKTLGSYGLLYDPGDFAFISAKVLSDKIGHTKSFSLKEIFSEDKISEDELWSFLKNYKIIVNRNGLIPIVSTKSYCSNIYDFVLHYLRLNIGDFTCLDNDFQGVNQEAKILIEEIFRSLLKNKDINIQNFAKEYLGNSEFNEGSVNDGGGYRIVWAKTHLD